MNTSIFLQKIIICILLTISATLLAFVGIFALDQSMKLKMQAFFSPDLFCKIEYSTNNTDFITIFDNNYYSSYIDNDYVTLGNSNNIKLKNTVRGGITSTIYLRLTNYNSSKNVRLIANNFTQAPSITYETSETWCSSYNNAIPTVSTPMSVSFSSVSGTSNINFNLKVDEVYKVEFNGGSLITNETTYVPLNTNLDLTLNAVTGAYLPNELVVTVSGETLATSSYTYNNITGEVLISADKIDGDVVIDCDGDSIYEILEYTTTITNGKSSSPTTYEYAVKIGEYPQNYVGNDLNATLSTAYTAGTLTPVTINSSNISYEQSIYDNSGLTNKTIKWYYYNETKYARSTSFASNAVNFSNGTAVPTTTSDFYWFEVKPIYWTVIGAINPDGSNRALSTLYYRDNCLFTDALMGKPFTGKLLLLSELALDGLRYDNDSSYFGSGGITYDFLNNTTTGNFAIYSGLSDYFATSGTENLVSYTTLSNYGYYDSAVQNYATNANIFLLSGQAGADATKSFVYSSYFDLNAPNKASVGLAPPSDYALAHYVYTTSSASTYSHSWTPHNSASALNCSYWLRSGTEESSITAFNIVGSTSTAGVSELYYGVRPAFFLNLGV